MALRSDERDGRTIVACVVPYLDVATVRDRGGRRHRETFSPGAFHDQVARAQTRPLRLWLTVEHADGLENVIGHAVKLRETDRSLWADLRVWDGDKGDEALARIRDGTYAGVSMEVRPLRSHTRDGIVRQTRAHLNAVTLARRPAYANAKILSIRRDWTDDQPPPSAAELHDWNLQREHDCLVSVACNYPNTRTPGYRVVTSLLKEIDRRRAELAEEKRQLKPRVLRRACGEILEIR